MKKTIFLTLLCLLGIGARMTAQAANPEIYAVLSDNGKTLTLYYDDQRTSRGGVTDWSIYNNSTWVEDDRSANNVTLIVLDESMQNARPTSTERWFEWFRKVTKIEHLDYLNTSEVTSMRSMFYNMHLTELDVSGFDTHKVEIMTYMFSSCSELKDVDVSGFNTENVKRMNNMFSSCYNLTSLDIRNFDFKKVTDTYEMFAYCSALTTILCNEDLNTYSSISNYYNMFGGCNNLVGGKGTLYDGENANDITFAHPDEGKSNPGYFTYKALPTPTVEKPLTGLFSVSADKQVVFSQGNLQYQASTDTWRFASNQYEIIGEDNSMLSATYNGWIDLFGFGTSGYNDKHPWMISTNEEDYADGGTGDIYGTEFDWGTHNPIVNGGNKAGLWYTMPMNEWNYLLKTRANAEKLQGIATVNGVKGYVLLPDNWQLPDGMFTALATSFYTNNYDINQWQAMENKGAVFLPVGGHRDVDYIDELDRYGEYWTSTADPDDIVQAGEVYFGIDAGYTTMMVEWATSKVWGFSVRLVQEKEEIISYYTVSATVLPAEAGVVEGQGDYEYGTDYTLTLEPAEGWELKEWRDGTVLDEKSNTLTGYVYGNIQIECVMQKKGATAIDDAVENQNSNAAPRKLLRNGRVYILRNGKTFTTDGRELDARGNEVR